MSSSVQYCGCKLDSLVVCLDFDPGILVNVCPKHEKKYCKQAQRVGLSVTKREVIFA